MLTIRSTLALGSLALVLLAGCNLPRLLAFRSQMHAFNEFTKWEGAAFVFKKPLLTLRDLNAVGLYPEKLNEDQAVLCYQRHGAPPGAETDYVFRLQLVDGKLAGVVIPAPLRDGIGQDNIRGFFALLGGREIREAGMHGIPKAQLIASGLFPASADPPGREAVIDLRPCDARNHPIWLKFAEMKKVDRYDVFFFRFKPDR